MKLFGSSKSKKNESFEERLLGKGIAVSSKAPKGFSKKVMTDVPVAGISYRQIHAMDFIKGKDRQIDVRREFADIVQFSDEPLKEATATAVYGLWVEGKERKEAHIGYLPDEVHSSVAHLEIAAVLVRVFPPFADRKPGLRLDIYAR